MATLTAQIIVGRGHPNDDGIIPTHQIFLSENSRPAWVLKPENTLSARMVGPRKVVWIPTLENMLEDALLMVAIHIVRDEGVVRLAKQFCADFDATRLQLYDDFNEEQRKELYLKCRKVSDYPKLIVSTFKRSHIENQLSILREYSMDIEVCPSIYAGLSSSWSGQTYVEDSLEKQGTSNLD